MKEDIDVMNVHQLKELMFTVTYMLMSYDKRSSNIIVEVHAIF
jgi:hypothetical protein